MGTGIDVLGFTKQTEVLLHGVRAQNLIEECKKRNISTDVLHKLTKEDFMQLGANENQAEEIVGALHISRRKTPDINVKPHHRIINQVEILQVGEKQLSIIQDFVKYCKLKLRRERINFFVDLDKALSASQVLCAVADATLQEVNEAKFKLKELEDAILVDAVMPKEHRKHSYVLYTVSFSGLCVATYILFRRFWR